MNKDSQSTLELSLLFYNYMTVEQLAEYILNMTERMNSAAKMYVETDNVFHKHTYDNMKEIYQQALQIFENRK